MRHGRHPVTKEACGPRSVMVLMGNRQAAAVADCICGLAEYEGFDVDAVAHDLVWEHRLLELDVPELRVA